MRARSRSRRGNSVRAGGAEPRDEVDHLGTVRTDPGRDGKAPRPPGERARGSRQLREASNPDALVRLEPRAGGAGIPLPPG